GLQRLVCLGMFAYLGAHLIQSYDLPAGDTALPLVIAGSGAIVGGWLGGRVADHRQRLAWYALSCVGSGVLAALAFTTQVSPWATAVLACGAATLAGPSLTVTPALLLEVAGPPPPHPPPFFPPTNPPGPLPSPPPC